MTSFFLPIFNLALSVRCKPKIEFHLTDPFIQLLNPAASEPNAASGTLRLAKRCLPVVRGQVEGSEPVGVGLSAWELINRLHVNQTSNR